MLFLFEPKSAPSVSNFLTKWHIKLLRLTFVVDPVLVHSTKVVEFPSAGREDGQAEDLREGDQEVPLRGEEEEAASRGACPLQGGENSLEINSEGRGDSVITGILILIGLNKVP
jgi:hypothetical protein